MNKKVSYARLQTELHSPSVGQLGIVFPPQTKTLEELDMRAKDGVLSISFRFRGIHKELLIPYGNVVVMDVDTNEKTSPPDALF